MAWKKAELWWVNALSSLHLSAKAVKRWPSQGTDHPDIEGPDFVMEHKERHSMPQWFLHALDQAEQNDQKYPEKRSLVGMTYQRGRGYPARRFVVLLVRSEDEARDIVTRLTREDSE